MRPIKFRAWDLIPGKMVNVDSLHFNADGSISGVGIAYPAKKGFIKDHRSEGDDLILMQFTGLLDKNGKEIYEGDIVSFKSGGTFGKDKIQVDMFNLHIGIADADPDWRFDEQSFEVLGNIYENPELLKP